MIPMVEECVNDGSNPETKDIAVRRPFRIASRPIVTAAAMAFAAMMASVAAPAQDQASDDGFRDIRVAPGLAVAGDFMEVLMPFLRGHPESEEGNAGLDLKVRKEGSGYQVEIVMTGYLDDSLYGEHYRGYVIRTATGKWELLSMKVKPLCVRGENVNGICTSEPPAMFLAPGSASQGEMMCVTVAGDDVLNVRQGPGTRHAVSGYLEAGTCNVELTDICEGTWCEIQSSEISGWVNTRYLALAE